MIKSARTSITRILMLVTMLSMWQACTISYKFNGAALDYNVYKTIYVSNFPIRAALVYPPLQQTFENELLDYITRNTRLQTVDGASDLQLEGEITGYQLTPMAVSADSYAAETKLTITVRVRFTNNVNPEESFEKSYTAYQTFDASQMLNDVQDELCNTMIQEIADQIYNDTVAKW